jgi:hypothetical protein
MVTRQTGKEGGNGPEELRLRKKQPDKRTTEPETKNVTHTGIQKNGYTQYVSHHVFAAVCCHQVQQDFSSEP